MPKIQIQDAEYHYQTYGSGHPVLFISGYSVDHTLWFPIKDLLSKHFKLIVFDNRAAGQTQDSGRELSAELMAEDAFELIEALELKNPHIVGQSMGGTIAQILASKYGSAIGKLMLLVTSAKWRSPVLLANSSLIRMMEEGLNPETIIEAKASWVFGSSFLNHESNLEFLKKRSLENPHRMDAPALRRQFAVLESYDGEEYLDKIESDTMIVYGDEDLIASPGEARHLAAQIRGSKLKELKGAHGLILEDPKGVAETMVSFLSG